MSAYVVADIRIDDAEECRCIWMDCGYAVPLMRGVIAFTKEHKK